MYKRVIALPLVFAGLMAIRTCCCGFFAKNVNSKAFSARTGSGPLRYPAGSRRAARVGPSQPSAASARRPPWAAHESQPLVWRRQAPRARHHTRLDRVREWCAGVRVTGNRAQRTTYSEIATRKRLPSSVTAGLQRRAAAAITPDISIRFATRVTAAAS